MQEIKEFDDIFHSCGCLLNQTNSVEEFKAIYALALDFARKEDRVEELLQWKLEEVTGFCGSNNQDFTDFINVIKMVKDDMDKRDKKEPSRLILPFYTKTEFFGVSDVAQRLSLPESYVNLIYCVLDHNNCMNYGTSLQFAWLDDLGEEMIEPELGPKFLEFFKEKMQLKSQDALRESGLTNK